MKLVCYDDGLGLHVSHFLQSSPGISIKIFTVPCFTGFLFHHLHAAPNFFNLSAGWHLVLYLDFPNALTHVFFNDLCSKIIYLKIKKKYFCCLLKSLFMRQKFVLFLSFYHPCESLHQILAALQCYLFLNVQILSPTRSKVLEILFLICIFTFHALLFILNLELKYQIKLTILSDLKGEGLMTGKV